MFDDICHKKKQELNFFLFKFTKYLKVYRVYLTFNKLEHETKKLIAPIFTKLIKQPKNPNY